MSELINVLSFTAALLLVVIVGLAVFGWYQVHRNDQLADQLDRVHHDLAVMTRERNAARYQVGQLEQRLVQRDRDVQTRRVRGYVDVDMPTINGKRLV